MFRDDAQRSRVAMKILAGARMNQNNQLWDICGPTTLAVNYVNEGAPLSHGEIIMLRVAFDVWNSEGLTRFGEILYTLDEQNLRAVGSLICSMATGDSDAIDAWLEDA